MKKIFSLFAAILFAGSMMAEPIVINASDVTGIESGATSGLDVTLQGINIVWQGAYYNSDGSDGGSASVDFRVYANKSMTLTAESNISKVEIAGYCKAGLTVTANAGTITTGASYASETTKGTLEDPLIVVDEIGATSVTLTCTKQVRAYTLRITLGGDVTPPAVATPVISGDAEFTDSVIVTMTCSTEDADIYYTIDGTTDPKCDCSAAPEYKKPIVIKETTTIKAAAYTGNDWSAVATKTFTKKEKAEPITCAAVYELAKGTELALNNVVVAYANGKNVYVQDATGAMLVYLTANTTWKAGDVLSGVEGVLDIYNGLYELKPTAEQAAAVTATAGEAPAATEMTAAPVAADMNKYILLKDVIVSAATFPSNKNMDATIGDGTFVLRNQFNADIAFDTAKKYDITGVVAVYNSTVQVYFIGAKEAGDAPADKKVVYDWEEKVGTTILGTTGVEISTVKIHNNTDEVAAIKFGNSYAYADGKWIAIKPAEGKFLAGDKIVMSGVINNDATDGSKYAQIDAYAADGATSLFRGDTLVNGKKSAADPKIEVFTLKADQDSIFFGRYGNTGMFVTLLNVVRGGEEPQPETDTITCAKAAEDALAGKTDEVVVKGYVTEIATEWSAQYKNISFWMADAKDGGKVIQAFRAVCEKEADAPIVGDLLLANGKLKDYVKNDVHTPELDAGCTFAFIEKVPRPEPQPTTIADTITVAKAIELGMKLDSMATDTVIYAVEGYVINAGSVSLTYMNQSYYMADAADAAASDFQAYNCFAIEGNDTLKVLNGDKVQLVGKLKKYYNKTEQKYIIEIEKGNASFISKTEGDHSIKVVTEEVTVAQALEIGAALADNAVTEKQYKITAYVSAVNVKSSDAYSDQYGNQSFWVADDQSSTASTNADGAFYVYRGKPSTAKEIALGSKVEFTCTIKKYVPAGGGDPVIENADQNILITVLEEPAGPELPDGVISCDSAVALAKTIEDPVEVKSTVEGPAVKVWGYVTYAYNASEKDGIVKQSAWLSDVKDSNSGVIQGAYLEIASMESAVVKGDYVQIEGTLAKYLKEGKDGKPNEIVIEVINGKMAKVSELGIENIELTVKAQKVIVDGVLYIIRDNKMYNVQGLQVR